MSNRVLASALALGSFVAFGPLAAPAHAATCLITSTECSANLDIISAANIGSGSQGTVDLLLLSPTEVQVTVTLTPHDPALKFINSGGPHTPFVFNLDPSLTGVSIAIDTTNSSSSPQPFSVLSGSQDATPYGTFTNGIGVAGDNGSKPDAGNFGPLVFDVTATGGINLLDFITNGPTGYLFAADLFGTGGNTGSVAAQTLICVEGCSSDGPALTPLPGAVWLLGTVLAGGAGFGRWRNRRNRQPAA